MKQTSWVIKTIVPEEVYTDRAEFLEFFYKISLKAATRRTMSTVLLGQRRMGKTEIFKRVVNRLFFEQNPKSENAVVPVYFSFSDTVKNEKDFAKQYIENFMHWYIGFYTSQPELVLEKPKGTELIAIIEKSRNLYPFTRTLDLLLKWHIAIVEEEIYLSHQDAVEIPRRISDIDDTTIVMFLDEFQNTRLPQYNFDIVGHMQEAVESPTCPHFVTGSAMSILAREIIGRGSLFGRFRSREINSLSEYHGTKLAIKAAHYYEADVEELMAPAISNRCGGNPFYITSVVHQAAELDQGIYTEKDLNKILAVDLSSGFIWGELNDQVNRWMERVNEYGITKWILYLSALDENTEFENRDRLNVERIRQELKRREGKDISIEKIRDVLIKLSRGDLLEYLELGDWFRRVKDPILLEFLKVWGKIEVEGQNSRIVKDELEIRHQKLEKRIREYRGYLAEIHMSQVLLNGQRKTLPGKFFNNENDIRMPRFIYVEHRHRPGSGKNREIDVFGAAGIEKWVCQSKWLKEKKAGIDVVKILEQQAQWLKQEDEDIIVSMWIFTHNGLTGPAKKFAKENHIFWSDKKDFNGLLEYLGLRPLPGLMP